MSSDTGRSKPICQYAERCYRKNPAHFVEFDHPHLNNAPEISPKSPDDLTVDPPPSKRFKSAASSSEDLAAEKTNAFGLYLSKVRGIADEFNAPGRAISLDEILASDYENLQSSYQFNYMVDVQWLISKFTHKSNFKPLHLIFQTGSSSDREFLKKNGLESLVKISHPKLPIAYGTHHTKMMIFLYEFYAKVVIHTANLIEEDWDQKSEGIYISPNFPKSINGEMKDSETEFGKDLIAYLKSYKLEEMNELCEKLKIYDFSPAKVFLIPSTPGRFPVTKSQPASAGHSKLKTTLKKFASPSPNILAQFSSIGSLGPSPDNWLCSEFLESLSACKSHDKKKSNLHLIFPCVEDVRTSLQGYPAGGSLPYSTVTDRKQKYLHTFLHKWRAEKNGRSRASPHIKSYLGSDADWSKIHFFLLTSANLSKAAWGVFEKQKSQLMIRSYELGVLFLPEYFNLNNFEISSEILPYDLPPTKYDKNDRPWTWDEPHSDAPDTFGNVWRPS